MADTQPLANIVGRNVVDRDGDKIGKVFDVYVDEDTGQPEWLAVQTGMFGSRISFVPLTGVTAGDDDVTVDWDKATIKDAPHAEADGQLSQDEEAQLYAHYGLGYSEQRSDSGLPAKGAPDMDRKVRSSGAPDDAMTRSEEELSVDKVSREAGRARLHKWVETEHVNVTVPVRREKAKLVTEPITDANRAQATDGPDITEAEHEVVLSEEEVVVDKQVVPKERVRLETEEVVEQRTVEADLDKERIEFEKDTTEDR